MGGKVIICGINTANLPKLSQKESKEYLIKIANGDKTAREQFIVSNMRLVLSIIKRFWAKTNQIDDLFQAGVIGLIKAIDNFDLSFNVKFSTYSVPLIIGEIKRFLRDRNSLRVARSIRDTAYLAIKAREELEKEDKEATLTEIANRLNVAEREVAYSLDAISDTVSLYDPVYNKNGDELLLMDKIEDVKCHEENWTEKVAIKEAFENLDEREKKIIKYRYFLGKTQTEISKKVGISQAQVSRIEKEALSQIKLNIQS